MSQFYRSGSLMGIQEGLRIVYEKMIQHEQKGEYQDAQRCRVEWEHRKEELKNKQIYEMQMRHNKERNRMTQELNEEIRKLDEQWNQKMTQFHQKSEENIANLMARHQEESKKLQQQLQSLLSTKVKESSELLNLRKMQEQMAKQKNYVEAHRVQQKIKKLFAHQQQSWLQKRAQKINQALINLRYKQSAELSNLKQRIKITTEDNTKDHHFQGLKIRQRYENLMKDLKAQQQREVLSFKGQLRTLGGGSPTSSPNKSNISVVKV